MGNFKWNADFTYLPSGSRPSFTRGVLPMSSLMFSAILALLLLAIFEVVEPIVQDFRASEDVTRHVSGDSFWFGSAHR